MLLLFAAAAALASPPQNAPNSGAGAAIQARATIRIISGAALRLGEGTLSGDAPQARDTVVHTDGAGRPARLIEFQ
jgi:hypothetical protein